MDSLKTWAQDRAAILGAYTLLFLAVFLLIVISLARP